MALDSRAFADLCDGSKSLNRLPHRIAPAQTIELIGLKGVKNMKTSNWKKGFVAIMGSGLMLANVVCQAQENVQAEVTFVDAITVTEDSPMQFGLIDEALNTETIIIAPDDTVTGDGTGFLVGGVRRAADLTIGATSGVAINILIDAVVNGTGYALTSFICDYQAGADLSCDGAGMNVTSVSSGALRVGVTLTGDNLAVAGNADGSFDVTVIYQ